jgi:hypothetical protein
MSEFQAKGRDPFRPEEGGNSDGFTDDKADPGERVGDLQKIPTLFQDILGTGIHRNRHQEAAEPGSEPDCPIFDQVVGPEGAVDSYTGCLDL